MYEKGSPSRTVLGGKRFSESEHSTDRRIASTRLDFPPVVPQGGRLPYVDYHGKQGEVRERPNRTHCQWADRLLEKWPSTCG
jgi:hypothetical protein